MVFLPVFANSPRLGVLRARLCAWGKRFRGPYCARTARFRDRGTYCVRLSTRDCFQVVLDHFAAHVTRGYGFLGVTEKAFRV